MITPKESPVDADQLAAVSLLISAQTGWRFFLMSNGTGTPPNDMFEPLDEQAIRARLNESVGLLDTGHSEAAFVLGWAAIEALLRSLIIRDGNESRRNHSASLLRAGASEGLINRDQLELLNAALQSRNTIVHGHRSTAMAEDLNVSEMTTALLKIAEALLLELHA